MPAEKPGDVGPVRLKGIGLFLRIVGGIPSLFWIAASYVVVSDLLGNSLEFPIIPAIVIGLTLKGITRALGLRLKAESAEEVMSRDPRPPVVLLRSFASDRISLFAHWTFEEQLAKVLRRIGPVISIGNPKDRLTPLGAARLYVSDESWPDRVVKLLDSASCVVIFAGTTTGLLWEVETAIKRARRPESILIVLPQTREESLRQRRYGEFRGHFASMLPSLPPRIGAYMFLRFAPEWEPDFFGPPLPKKTWGLSVMLHIQEALEPFFVLLQQSKELSRKENSTSGPDEG
jgi:hypothetical protein